MDRRCNKPFCSACGGQQAIPTTDVCSEAAIAIARAGPAQAATLIKNDGGALPLGASAARGVVAVIGPNGNLSKAVAGYYGGNT